MIVAQKSNAGRPALSGAGWDAFYRIPPYLCVAFGLSRGDNDNTIIKSRLIQAIALLKKDPQNPVCQVEARRSEYGVNRKGWVDRVTKFNIWMTEALADAVADVLRDSVEYLDDAPQKVDSTGIRRLLTIAAAAEGFIQPENWTAPTYQDYLASENPQADFLGLRVVEDGE